MKKLLLLVVFMYLTVNAMELFTGQKPVIVNKNYNASEGNNEFMIKAYHELSKDKKNDNIFFSPFSISSALAMTFAGSDGNTETEMAKALEFSANNDKFHHDFSIVTNKINEIGKKGNVKLSIANSLWLQDGYTFLDKFINIGKKYYGAEIENLNFAESEKSRQIINEWVEKKTNNKIKNLIPKGILDALTKLVLTNAVYFKGEWKEQFKNSGTKKSVFHNSQGNEVSVNMMYNKARYGYYENDKFQFLEMPYKGKEVSMFVLLPKQKDGLKKIEASLDMLTINNAIDNLIEQQVKVYFPKFKLSLSYRLANLMKNLGMNDAFSKKADFSKMTGTKELYISAIIHKTFIEVDEKGTEAAAATAVVMRMKSAPPMDNPEFKADHPFFYFIRENSTGTILFTGRMNDPSKE
ncbi:MAG: serpin family protein [Candidatus Delongbacteria bacterium]|jgi:serpin B|nr:serpin family protein [Candidatus Delongbacteria bacterium]